MGRQVKDPEPLLRKNKLTRASRRGKPERRPKTEEVVTPGRLELPTRSLGNCCSIHLSYGAILE